MAAPKKPTKLTPALITGICELIALTGCYYATACIKLGINSQTAHEWRERGEGRHNRPPTPLYRELAIRVSEAEGERNVLLIGRIKQAVNGGAQTTETRTERVYALNPDGTRGNVVAEKVYTTVRTAEPIWQAAAWMLQRLQPEQWGKREYLELAGDITARAIVALPEEDEDMSVWQNRYGANASAVPGQPTNGHGGNGTGNGHAGNGHAGPNGHGGTL